MSRVQTRKPREKRDPLSRERVLATAIELADTEGIDTLSMRRLAQRLGVEAMTLYHYVPSKSALVEGMVRSVLAEIRLPPPGAAWKPALRDMALSAHEVLLRHPWAASRILSMDLTPERLRYMESILRAFRAGGFDAYQAHLGYHAVESHIVGFTLWLAGMALPDDLHDVADAALASIPAEEHPYVIEHIREHLRPRRRTDVGTYEFGLDLVLDGLEGLIRSERR